MKSIGSLNIDDKNIIKNFIKSKIKNANIIIDYLKFLHSDDIKEIKKSLAILNKIFCSLIAGQDIKIPNKLPSNVQSAKDKYNNWLYDRYDEFHNQLLELLFHSEKQICQLALNVSLRLLQKEANFPITKEEFWGINFPLGKLKVLVAALLSTSNDNVSLIVKFREYLEYPDFLCVTLNVVASILNEDKIEKGNRTYLANIFSLLEVINLPIPGGSVKPLNSNQLFVDLQKKVNADEDHSSFIFPYEETKFDFNSIWEVVLHFNFSSGLYKKCLVLIPEKVLIHLETPVILTDFFLNAYNLGGDYSLMALQGVFILVNQYNLEYPDFYDKLYTLLDATIFQAKFKARFFMLCDKFFSSPLLPEYIIAAFLKRMCRLLLVAPTTSSLVLLLKFIANLLLRFPNIQFMIHSENVSCIENDPFLAEEVKPKLTLAAESSLWEIMTLRTHPLCGIAKAANFIDKKNLPDFCHEMSNYTVCSTDQLYEKTTKLCDPETPIDYHSPTNQQDLYSMD